MENENQNTNEAAELVKEFPLLGELLGETPSQPMSNGSPEAEPAAQKLEPSPPAQAKNVPAATQTPMIREVAPAASHKVGDGEASPVASAEKDNSEVQQLRTELEKARGQLTQLERERWLLSQGIPEEDLDYYAFKIGKLVTPEKDFAAAAKDYLKNHRGPRGISTGAGLSGRVSKVPGINDTMNRLIRGDGTAS